MDFFAMPGGAAAPTKPAAPAPTASSNSASSDVLKWFFSPTPIKTELPFAPIPLPIRCAAPPVLKLPEHVVKLEPTESEHRRESPLAVPLTSSNCSASNGHTSNGIKGHCDSSNGHMTATNGVSASVSPSSARRTSVTQPSSQPRKRQKTANGDKTPTSTGTISRAAALVMTSGASFTLRCCFSHCDYVPHDVEDCVEHIRIHRETRYMAANNNPSPIQSRMQDIDSMEDEEEEGSHGNNSSSDDDDESLAGHDDNNSVKLSCFYQWCADFNHSFATQALYFTHIREQHDESRLRCLYCPNNYTQQHNRQMHVSAVHPGEAAWHCAGCGFKSFVGRTIGKHMKNCALTKALARENGSAISDIQIAATKQPVDPSVLALLSDKSFPGRKAGLLHCSNSSLPSQKPTLASLSSKVAVKAQSSRPMLECFYEWCPFSLPRSFNDEVSCVAHLRIDHDQTRFRCKLCDVSYTRREAQGHHVLGKHPGRAYIFCMLCGMEFNNAKKLRVHECVFNNTAADARHETRHVFNLPVPAPVPVVLATVASPLPESKQSPIHSPSLSSSSSSITSSKTTPSPSRSLTPCNSARSSSPSPVPAAVPVFELPDQCHFEFCGIPVTNAAGWLHHLESIHLCSTTSYCCRFCPVSFGDRGSLLIHLNEHQGQQKELWPFWCQWCGSEKSELDSLEQHEAQCKLALNQAAVIPAQ